LSEEQDKYIHIMGLPKKHLYLLPLDGSRAMTGDLLFGGNLAKFLHSEGTAYSVCIRGGTWSGNRDQLNIVNWANTDLRDIRLRNIVMGSAAGYISLTDGATLCRPAIKSATYDWYIDSSDGVDYLHVMHGVGGYVDIPRAGDITFLAGKKFLSDVTLDDAKKLLWSDVNLYRVAPNVLRTDDDLQVNNSIRIDGAALYFNALADVNLYRAAADVLKTDDAFDANSFKVAGAAGADGSFTTVDGKTVTVVKGLITSIV